MSETKVIMPASLTAENGAKALLIGEFYETIEVTCDHCDGSGSVWVGPANSLSGHDADCGECGGSGKLKLKVFVSWPTIKAIYNTAVSGLSEQIRDARNMRW